MPPMMGLTMDPAISFLGAIELMTSSAEWALAKSAVTGKESCAGGTVVAGGGGIPFGVPGP